MKRSNRLVLLVGIFLALVAFVLILVTLRGGQSGSSGPTAPPTTVGVVVATANITLGSKIGKDQVTTQQFAIGDRPGDSYTDPALVVGKIARQSISDGQYVSTAVINGTGGTLTNIEVPAGLTGIAVQVDQVTGVGTLIKPGDHVDLVTGITGADKVPLVSYTYPAASPRPGTTPAPQVVAAEALPYNPTTVKTLVEGILVLGTLLPAPTAANQPAAGGDTSGTGSTSLNGQQEIVLLAVTTQQAEAIKFSQMDGTISLILRSTTDCQAADGTASPCPIIPTTGVTLRRMVDDFGVLPPQVVQVLNPTPYPSPFFTRPYPSPSPIPSPTASANPSASANP